MYCKLSGFECRKFAALHGEETPCGLLGLYAENVVTDPRRVCPMECSEEWQDLASETERMVGVLTVRTPPIGEEAGIKCSLSMARDMINREVFIAGVWTDACNRIYLR
jgi:hypothetical protein